jgi:hypothetical protein
MKHFKKSTLLSICFGPFSLVFLIMTMSATVFPQLIPPPNDMFANAETIGGTRYLVSGSTLNASSESGEPMFYKGERTVWYRWTAPSNLSMTFDVKAYGFDDAVVTVFAGEQIEDLTLVALSTRVPRVTVSVQAGSEYKIQVSGKTSQAAGSFDLMWAINGAESWKQFNFDGEQADFAGLPSGKSDYAILRWLPISTLGPQWWIWQSNTQTPVMHRFGGLWTRHSGDFDGDGTTDLALWDSSTAHFWIQKSSDGSIYAQRWGTAGDLPVQGDFDGDDIADMAIWRPSTGTFWVLKSSDEAPLMVQWGMSGDKLACGDYDGDGITDFGVKRGADGSEAVFFILRSSDRQFISVQFGFGDDQTVPGDYDGDGKNDIAVFRPGNGAFYYIRSSDSNVRSVPTGQPRGNWDHVVPGDYAGERISDLCVYRAVSGSGYFNCVADGGDGDYSSFKWGLASALADIPVAGSNVH